MGSTPDTVAGHSPPARSAAAWLRAILEVARGRRQVLVHLQHNPDPDALASGVAIQYLLKRTLDLETVLAHTGQVGRAENRAMLRWLEIQIIPSFKIDYDEYDLFVVVDTHPGSGTCHLPEGLVPDIVVDHHPTASVPDGVGVAFLDTTFGSASTMVGWLLLDNGIRPDARVATALTYGIKTDTLDLARAVGPTDERVYRELYALADKRLLGRIQRARLSQEYFQVLERGLRRAQVTDFVVTTHLGSVDHPDAVAEIADILFRLEGMKWAMVAGTSGPLPVHPRHPGGRGERRQGRGADQPRVRRGARDVRRRADPAAHGRHDPGSVLRGRARALLRGHARQAQPDAAPHDPTGRHDARRAQPGEGGRRRERVRRLRLPAPAGRAPWALGWGGSTGGVA
jgi:nanoRNase/pAp phosphatase (c-di-AMP/oligoRNAs hydrolase)